MPNPNGRPKGPPKKRVMVTVLQSTYEWLEKKARENESPATYLARNLDQQAANAIKSKAARS